MYDFSSIEPYTAEQVPAAIARLAHHPMFRRLAKTMNPNADVDTFASLMECISTCDELQYMIMRPLMFQLMKRSMNKFSVDGLDKLDRTKSYLFVSNHRDITLDAALLDVVFLNNGYKTPEIGFGNNLMQNDFMVDIFRLNKMFTIIRDGSRREFYNNSVFLSNYIRHVLLEKQCSVWIAQRNGRTKDGNDRTDQGLLKMFSMAGNGNFEEDFNLLNIVPVAVSYEFEPCDTMKTLAVYTSLTGLYVKSPHEDVISIMTGISQQKGDVHISICDPISPGEVARCAALVKNERFNALAKVIDDRIHSNYKLHKTNYIAYDLLSDEPRFEDFYSTSDMEHFIAYVEKEAYKGPSMAAQSKLYDIFLQLYANPVVNQMNVSE